MSKPLAFGLSLSKKPSASKPAPPKRKPVFGADDDSDNDSGAKQEPTVEAFGGDFNDFDTIAAPATKSDTRKGPKSKAGLPSQPPKLKSKTQPNMMFGDLSSSLTSKKHAEAAAAVDSSVYEYDTVYDSLKPKKASAPEDQERRPKYMKNLLQAAEVRKRDALIAEEKKIAREREAEGEEYEGKEKFVTDAYRKQQEENRRIEEEEKKREEEEAKKNQGGGMSAFYRNMLNKDELRHSEAVKAAEDAVKDGLPKDQNSDEVNEELSDANRALELNEKGASIALNEDGQVVDKRQLLRGGLNLGAKKSTPLPSQTSRPTDNARRPGMTGAQVGSKQAMRERQSRMLAEQLEQSMKRSRDDVDAQRMEAERSAKTRKTEGEIMGAKERYLARKKAAEEAKKAVAE